MVTKTRKKLTRNRWKKKAYYNKIPAGGVVDFAVSFIYLRTVVVTRADALTQPPYHPIWNGDFLGSKYDDTTGTKEE